MTALRGVVLAQRRVVGTRLRLDLGELRGQLRAVNLTAQHESTKPEPRPVVAAMVTRSWRAGRLAQ
jgi:hypothetical protein